MSTKTVLQFLMVAMVAGVLSSCGASNGPPDGHNNPSDTMKIIPDSGTVTTHDLTTFRIIPKNFQLPPRYSVNWIMDTTHFAVSNKDTVSYSFSTSGVHIVSASLLDSSGHTIATAKTIQTDTNHISKPNDTSSHNFVWTETQLPNTFVTETNATGCAVFGAKDIYAINWYLYHYDGSAWQRVNLKNSDGSLAAGLSGASLFGFSANDLWVVYGNVIFHWNGSSDKEYRLENTGVWHYPEDGVPHSAWGTSSSNMYFVGDSGTIMHFDGTNWTKMSTPTRKALSSIWGTSNDDIWAAGYNTSTSESEVLHYDGSSWKEDILATSGTAYAYGIGGVYASDSAGHKVVVTSGSEIFRRTDGGPWKMDATVPNGDHIGIGVYGNSANDLLVVGGWGVVAHWSGKSWKRYDQFYDPGAFGYGANTASTRGNTACIVGMKNGTSWVLIGQRQ